MIGRPKDPDLISVAEASGMLGVREDTVKRWCQEGRLPAVKKGFRWWVRQDELLDARLDQLMTTNDLEQETPGGSDGRPISERTSRATTSATSKHSKQGPRG